MMKTKLEIIEETVKYYSKDVSRRAYEEEYNKCQYKTPDGKMCAVGRCIINPKKIEDKYYGDSVKIDKVFSALKFKKGYEGHEQDFWSDLQKLHDIGWYWHENGLSEMGKYHVERLKQKWT